MKFRRKQRIEIELDAEELRAAAEAGDEIYLVEVDEDGNEIEPEGDEAAEPGHGPWDEDELPPALDGVERADLGSLLIPAPEGKEVRLQVDEQSGDIAAVLIAGPDGALELKAFAAPRHGDLWSDVLPQLRADVAQRGGATAERDGIWGRELLCQLQVQMPDGQPGVQPSRIIGVNGPRWMLRATFLGQPAVDPENAVEWERLLAGVVVRRGDSAMPQGEALPLTLPPDARRVE